MKYKIKLSSEAQLDLREARLYYYNISPQLKQKFDVSIFDAMAYISANLEYFQKRYRNIKIVFTKTFPYGIYYLVEDKTVFVQRILHQKQLYK